MGHKILIAGLQEAGKTAIKRVFFLKQQAIDVNDLKATIDYERMSVRVNNVPLTVVDLGGQRIFIRRFLNSFSPFIFNSVKILIFVIDVSVKSTRNNSVQYFAAAYEKLKEYSPNAEIYVFLHKNDLIRSSPNYESIHAQIKEQFQVECDQKLKFFRTTIFDEPSIINAFGRIFELSIPKAARSKLVDEKEITSGEEFSAKFAVEQFKPEDEQTCPFCNIQLFQTPTGYECNICGYIPKKRPIIADDEPIKPKVTVDDLKAKLSSAIMPQTTNMQTPTEQISNENSALNDIKKTISIGTLEANFDVNIPKILDLSFNRDETEKKLTSDQKKFLNYCYNIKIPIEVIRFILNEFIIKYNPKNLKTSDQNLLHAISFFKFGGVRDEEFVKFLFLHEYSPNMSIQDILWNNFPFPFKEKILVEQEEIDLDSQKLDDDALSLSFKENIGAKFHFNEFNLDIIFLKGKHKLGQITIPFDITPRDLKYMLVFELKFPIEKNLQGFVEESTQKLLSEIKEKRQTPIVEPEAPIVVIESNDGKTSDNYLLSDVKNIFYKIATHGSDFEIKFTKDAHDFGKITGPSSISASGLYQLVKDKTLIPTLLEEDELMFSTLEMFNKFSQFVSN